MQIIWINVKAFRFHFIHLDKVDGPYRHGGNADEVGGKARQRGCFDVGERQVFPETTLIDRHRSWFGIKFLDPNVYVDVNNYAEDFEDSMSFKIVCQYDFKICLKKYTI